MLCHVHSVGLPLAPTPWGTGRARTPNCYKWLGTGGHRE